MTNCLESQTWLREEVTWDQQRMKISEMSRPTGGSQAYKVNASTSKNVSSFTLNTGRVGKGQVRVFQLNMGIKSLHEDNSSY